mmetsp:Transcript_21217/g.60011  ORF Transcript_21217/g.60011 Transcript_21217/m.60011 type:complete len:471 (+) Transcript_21217:1157-2569(+)
MVELQRPLSALVVGSCISRLVLGAPLDVDLAVPAPLPDHRDLQVLLLLRPGHLQLLLLEGDLAWMVLVDDVNPCFLDPPLDLCGAVGRRKHHEEVLSLLMPIRIIDDFNGDHLLRLSGLEMQVALCPHVVVGLVRRAVLRGKVHQRLLVQEHRAHHLQLHRALRLQNHVVRLLEANYREVRDLRVLPLLCNLLSLFLLVLQRLPPEEGSRRVHAMVRPAVRCTLRELEVDERGYLILCEVATVLLPDLHRHVLQFLLAGIRNGPGAARFLLLEWQLADVGQEGNEYQYGEKQEGHYALCYVHTVGRRPSQDEEKPQVREDGGEGRHRVHVQILDRARLAGGDRGDADGEDAHEVEGRAPDDGHGAELARVEVLLEDLLDIQQDFWSARAKGHESEVGDGVIPDLHSRLLARLRVQHSLLLGRDHLDCPHEDVRNDGHAHEAPKQTEKVQNGLEPVRQVCLSVAALRQNQP